jgi:predicted nucleic acid-binding protein
MTDEHLLDSNILIYAYDTSEGEKHELARKLLEDCFMGQPFAVSLQNLTEFFNTITKKIERPISSSEAEDVIKIILEFKNFRKLIPTDQTLRRAMRLGKLGHFWDAMIAATMIENGITHIYTENAKDFQIPGITAINPFK